MREIGYSNYAEVAKFELEDEERSLTPYRLRKNNDKEYQWTKSKDCRQSVQNADEKQTKSSKPKS